MTKLKDETIKIETAIARLTRELEKLNKNDIQTKISDDKKLLGTLEELMENEELQKKYPKYNKLKKLYYILPAGLVTLLTIILILISILLGNITFTTFLPLLLLAADYVTYHAATKIFDKKITKNEKLKPYYDIYGDKQYSAKRTLKDVRQKEKELTSNKELLEECSQKEEQLHNYETTLIKLNNIRDSYIEQTLGDQYQDEINTITSELDNPLDKPRQYVKNKRTI